MDTKDRYGDKLREKERAEEERYFREQEKAALEKLRSKKSQEEEGPIRELAKGRCPKCGDRLEEIQVETVKVDKCPACKGIWLDDGELEELSKPGKESWLGSFLKSAISAQR